MDPFTLSSFFLLTALVGVIAWWKTRRDDLRESSGYFLAGRGLGWVTIAGSLYLTNISTEQMVGLNGSAYIYGASVMAWEVVAAIAMVFMAVFFLPRYLKMGITTLPQVIAIRFGRKFQGFISAALIIQTSVVFLPFVLYSGALALDELFKISTSLDISRFQTLWLVTILLGLVGGAYSVFGGLKAVAVSDTINGVGLLIGGMAIPFLGLIALGEGSLGAGLDRLVTDHPEKLSSLGTGDTFVPFGTLFTGMIIINVSYWCLNQFIIQRTLGARSLAEGQKGLLAAAFMKLVGILMLVLPGIIAFHLFGPDLPSPDLAYPRLVEMVLPSWLTGFFGAALFGAILSSFNSVLHSTSTLFSIDIYREWIKPGASDRETVLSGKIAGAVLVLFGICTAPFILYIEGGLFAAMKQYGSVIGTPTAMLIFGALFIRNTPRVAAAIALAVGLTFQLIFGAITGGIIWIGADGPVTLHWMHVIGITFVLMLLIMFAGAKLYPASNPDPKTELPPNFSLRTWKRVAPYSIAVVACVFAIYAALATFG